MITKNNNRYFVHAFKEKKIFYPPVVYPFKWGEHQLFAHRMLNVEGDIPIWDDYYFTVTDALTGAAIVTETNLLQAIADASSYLEDKGENKVIAAQAKLCLKYGKIYPKVTKP